jgi:Cys-tRNA(Pro)/Cys-tRNA(Cys) deacylase
VDRTADGPIFLVAMGKAKGSAGTPATLALTRAGVTFGLHPYEHDPGVGAYGIEAADALGVPHERVFKTLVAQVDDRLMVAIVPVDAQLDLKALAAVIGGKRAVMAEVAVAERTTGYVAGGISPFGQRKRLPTVLDETALLYPTVFVSAGRRGLDVEVRPTDLVNMTSASTAPIARR